MSVVNSLLKIDAGKLSLPQKEVNIKRLSESAGEPVVFVLSGVGAEKLEEIREMNTTITGDNVQINSQELRLAVISEGVIEPDLKDKKLQEHYGVKTTYDLIKKLLLAGERETIYSIIQDLSGYDEHAVEEVKKQLKKTD